MKKRKEIQTEIVINSRPAEVWKHLADFSRYPQWNPFIKFVKGELKQGNKVQARMEPPDATGMTFKPRILTVIPDQEIRWLGHFIIPGLFDGEHVFQLRDNADGTTTFIQREYFSGILISFFKKMLEDNTVRGFVAMNQGLKKLAEQKSYVA